MERSVRSDKHKSTKHGNIRKNVLSDSFCSVLFCSVLSCSVGRGVKARFDLGVLCPSTLGININLDYNWLADTRLKDLD